MKKTIAFLLIALLTLSFSAALADSVPMSKEDQMVRLEHLIWMFSKVLMIY